MILNKFKKNNSNQKVLVIAPLRGRMHGQRNISLRVESCLGENLFKSIDTNYEDKGAIYKIAQFFLSIPTILFNSKKFNVVYLSIKRSKIGILTDCIYIFLLTFLAKKVVIHVHGSEFGETFNKFSTPFRYLITFCYNRLSTIILLFSGLKSQYPFKAKKVILENYAPNFNHYKDVNINQKENKIFYLSLILEEKGVLNLIYAFEKFADLHPDFTLDIAGAELINSPDIKSIISASRHKKRINFHGFVDEKTKILLFKSSKIFCLPSYYKTEAQPTSLMEAICAQCICIGGNVGAIPDLLSSSKSHMIVNGKSINEIFDALNNAALIEPSQLPINKFLSEDEWCLRIRELLINDS